RADHVYGRGIFHCGLSALSQGPVYGFGLSRLHPVDAIAEYRTDPSVTLRDGAGVVGADFCFEHRGHFRSSEHAKENETDALIMSAIVLQQPRVAMQTTEPLVAEEQSRP